ncbi:MAG: 50S ribosomal protein L21 [Candidatus Buchananbacteria bacterium RIFCSPHIGHO2_01_FULL_39_14]|uniref:Large ribosomal subunit protein bL21 n=1 Tax=Candidatus Buchananbacteria bacterium RIFCSPHIGHO2_01_FULL_39_14 TaxID=1797532 RepID=A0A1G1XUV1_9BACT|nr:MAG: 50S ribosomal protein L21 [Candidatus Buchananbacteria bacterium RIFCSPHIGHO2_01_FULL_39_14]
MPLAVIKTGGKQYVVTAGQTVKIEKNPARAGQNVNFDALLIVDEASENFELGKPILAKKIQGQIIKQGKNDKIMVTKFKSKIRYRKRVGHRQPYSLVKIEKV